MIFKVWMSSAEGSALMTSMASLFTFALRGRGKERTKLCQEWRENHKDDRRRNK